MTDPKKTIPEGWKITTLGDDSIKIGDGNYSSKYPRADELLESGIPFISNKDLKDGRVINAGLRYLSAEKHAELKKGHLKTNDVLLSTRANIGDIALVTEKFNDANINAQLVFLRADEKLIHSKFLYFMLISDSYRSLLGSFSSGSAQSQLPIGSLKQVPLIIPTLAEQHAISEVLSSLDFKIEILREQSKTLEDIAQAIFNEWFVNFNYPGASGKLIDSELGQIPDGWKVGRLGDEARITMGQSPSGESYNKSNLGEIFFQGRADFRERFPKIRLYTTEPRRMAEKFDVLVSVRAPVGDVNVATEKCCIGRGLAAVSSEYKSFTLYRVKSLKEVFDKFEAEGTVFGSINKDSFLNIKVIIPPLEYRINFDRVVCSIDRKIFDIHVQILTLCSIRDTLLPKLMSGAILLNSFE